MEDIIVSLEPAFHRVERFMLWHNRYASLLAFFIGHCIFYAIARAGLRPFCAITLVVLIFHMLDCLKKKRSNLLVNGEQNLCELTKLVLRSYHHLCETHEKLNTLKTENRVKYSILIIIICLILAYIGVKINGFYVSYITMLILFTLPAIVYHKLIPKLLQRLAPVLEQLDQSMEYKRRSLLDRKDLLVKIDKSGSIDDDDDDDVRRLKQQRDLLRQEQLETKRQHLNITDDDDEDEDEDEEVNELKLIDTNDQSQTILNFRQRYQNETDTNDVALVPKQTNVNDSSYDMLSDSSSSVADDETARISELYANVGDQFDGKHRIKIKGDELKIKGRSNKQRPKLMDAQFFQSNIDNNHTKINKPSAPTLINTASNVPHSEPDLTSFDFLNDYDEKA
ncbi:unnamed protein product [Rotaria sp. Silwood2]|nr:unnamed protein product [Rotaria sp. Silwood2]CAF2659648.1 unnamed protein product [Rotaria sp. Silwood2]CAF3067511.1 unnamed protein product [Rotaria sp. Silwood2]CAF4030481.1 unnamed protein product [Rotaria sp. Silwood2]CAF4155659.1 unnamed protein product [Rotaria sp. Silwood2]